MGVDYYVGIAIGFHYLEKDVLGPFAKTIPEVTVEEDRFDSKTGEKISPVRVVKTKKYTTYEIFGKTIDDADDSVYTIKERALYHIAKILECDFESYGYEKDAYVVFSPKLKTIKNKEIELGYHFNVGAHEYELDELFEQQSEFLILGKKLFTLGLPEIKPKVGYSWSIS